MSLEKKKELAAIYAVITSIKYYMDRKAEKSDLDDETIFQHALNYGEMSAYKLYDYVKKLE